MTNFIFPGFNPNPNYPLLTHHFAGRFGNLCLEIFKTFLVAYKNNIPFNNIFFNNAYYKNFFSNFKLHFVDIKTINLNNFKTLSNYNLTKLDNINSIGIKLIGFNWIYPNSADSFLLFNKLFDNVLRRQNILSTYDYILKVPTIGLTVRRTDTLNLSAYKTLSENDIENLIKEYDLKFYNTENIFITSDDMEFLNKTIDLKLHPNVYLDPFKNNNENTITLLSLCNIILSNGSYFYMHSHCENKHIFLESTFGLIALLLHMSYKYI